MSEIKKEYQFPVYLFHKGENYRAYEFFGVHRIKGDTFALSGRLMLRQFPLSAISTVGITKRII